MKAYLTSFLSACAYTQEDKDYLLGVYDRLAAHNEAARCFEQAFDEYAHTPCDHSRILRLADEAATWLDVHEYTTELLVYLCLSKPLKERYRARGIEEAVFYRSMLDLRYKLEECKAVKGIVGSFVASWFEGFFELTRFALGRLQFEIVPFGKQYEENGRRLSSDSKVINVHIPRTGTPLDKEACRESYRQAAAFFADELKGDIAFVCHSWLLYPENEHILSTNSNIVRFMKRYSLVDWNTDKDKRDLWRLFDTEESHPDRLPTDTTARRLYVQHLKAGGKLGWGYGVYFWDVKE